MDQNRCLLDVIDNPQLLQSFLESESSADTHDTANATSSIATSTPNSTTIANTISTAIDTITTTATETLITTTGPAVSAETSIPTTSALIKTEIPQIIATTPLAAAPIVEANFNATADTSCDDGISSNTNDQDVPVSTQQSIESSSSIKSADELESTIQIKKETIAVTPATSTNFEPTSIVSTSSIPIIPSNFVSITTTATIISTNTTTTTTATITTTTTPTVTTTTTTAPTAVSAATTTTAPTTAITTINSTPTTVTTINATPTTTTKTTVSTTKKVPKKSTPRPSKAKANKNAPATSQPASVLTTQQTTTMPQYTTQQGQQQIVFQTNSGIRQPAILTSSPLGQTISGMHQQQRVIQIQTANGPMYFAIAPGPAMNNSPMVNQQTGMQSQQYSSQQICFQPNSTVMINRPQTSQQQQQQQQTNRPNDQFIHSNSSTPTSQQSDRLGQFTPELQQARCLTSPQTVSSPQQIRLQSPVIQFNGQTQTNQIQNTLPNQMSTVNGLNKNPQLQGQQQFATSQPGPIILQNRSAQGFGQQTQQVMNSQGSNIIVNGPQMITQSPQQTRITAPIMTGQTIAIPSQQNSQQQHIVLPSSQPMMMPRMSNQLILNRPLNSGQLIPGQQQFIQIQTPNGPMLLALPSQPAQSLNNTMIDYNNQVHQQQQQLQASSGNDSSVKTSPSKQSATAPSKAASNSKAGLDLADLLLDCGILPEERMTASQSPSNAKASKSPAIQQISSPMPSMPQMNSQMLPMDSSSLPPTPSQQPMPNYSTGQMLQQQPIRITIGPDGQMMMQPPVYGAIRPVLASGMGQAHLNTITPNNIVPSSTPMVAIAASSPSTPSNETNTDNKKPAKGKGTATKRSRSKKSDIDKFPILKTPKIAQQQQQQQQQQHQQQQQQQMQPVTVVPMTVLVGEQNKVLAGSDGKTNVAQLASGQQMSLAKIVTPVMQTTSLQPLVNNNMIQASIPTTNMIATPMRPNQSSTNSVQNTQLAVAGSGNSISASNMIVQSSSAIVGATTSTLTTPSASQMSSSGNVTTNLLQKIDKPGTVESNPHISSSLMPTLSLTVDTLKIEQNGLKTQDGQSQNLKAIPGNSGVTATLVLHQTQAQQQNSQNQLNQVQQIARQVDLRGQAILSQLGADQNAALNPQAKQSFRSLEDACKRLLRYHVFDTQTVNPAQLQEVDRIFEAAAESLISRKKAIYDKYRLLILKQSMKTVPSSEEVMLEQIFVNDELSFVKKERELFKDYEAQLESIALKQSRTDSKLDSSEDDLAPDYFAFGDNSPKHNNRDELDSAAHSRDVDDWLLTDKWGKSRYPSVPDNEAATAIESILNEELS